MNLPRQVSAWGIIRSPRRPGKWLLLRLEGAQPLTFPGGDVEEGENPAEILEQKLSQQICLDAPAIQEAFRMTFYNHPKSMHEEWIMFEVTPPASFMPRAGGMVMEMKYVSPRYVGRGSPYSSERRITTIYNKMRRRRTP